MKGVCGNRWKPSIAYSKLNECLLQIGMIVKCVFVCVCSCVRMCVYAHMYRGEKFMSAVFLSSSLFFETESPTETGALRFS